MIKLDHGIFKELSNAYGLHAIIIQSICTHPFLFAKHVMEDPSDYKDIMFAKLFRVKLKKMFESNKTAKYGETKAKYINGKRKEEERGQAQ